MQTRLLRERCTRRVRVAWVLHHARRRYWPLDPAACLRNCAGVRDWIESVTLDLLREDLAGSPTSTAAAEEPGAEEQGMREEVTHEEGQHEEGRHNEATREEGMRDVGMMIILAVVCFALGVLYVRMVPSVVQRGRWCGLCAQTKSVSEAEQLVPTERAAV